MFTFIVDDLKNISGHLSAFCEFLRSEDIGEDIIFSSKIVSSELISNVIIHSRTKAEVEGKVVNGGVSITVKARGFEKVNLSPPLPELLAESGRGMYIVNSLCSGNVERFDGGIRVFIAK